MSIVRIYPFIFVLLWSSAFITTKPIVDNSEPFSALAFRFFFVGVGFFLFCLYSKKSIIIKKSNLFQSIFSGIFFHGLYLGGVFFFDIYRYANWNSCFNCYFATHTNKYIK